MVDLAVAGKEIESESKNSWSREEPPEDGKSPERTRSDGRFSYDYSGWGKAEAL
jgi:hypothetical protein